MYIREFGVKTALPHRKRVINLLKNFGLFNDAVSTIDVKQYRIKVTGFLRTQNHTGESSRGLFYISILM
jgi:hypothetical protein